MLAYSSIPFAQMAYIGTPLSTLIMFGHISLTDTTLNTVISVPDNATINGVSLCSLISFGQITDQTPSFTVTLNTSDTVSYLVDGKSYVAPLEYVKGTKVEIEAVPAEGYQFKSWSSLSDTNPFTLEVTQDVELTATVELIPEE